MRELRRACADYGFSCNMRIHEARRDLDKLSFLPLFYACRYHICSYTDDKHNTKRGEVLWGRVACRDFFTQQTAP